MHSNDGVATRETTDAVKWDPDLEEVKKLMIDMEQVRCKGLDNVMEKFKALHQRILSLEKSLGYPSNLGFQGPRPHMRGGLPGCGEVTLITEPLRSGVGGVGSGESENGSGEDSSREFTPLLHAVQRSHESVAVDKFYGEDQYHPPHQRLGPSHQYMVMFKGASLTYFLRSRAVPKVGRLMPATQRKCSRFVRPKSTPQISWHPIYPARKQLQGRLCPILMEACPYMLTKEGGCFTTFAELKYTLHPI